MTVAAAEETERQRNRNQRDTTTAVIKAYFAAEERIIRPVDGDWGHTSPVKHGLEPGGCRAKTGTAYIAHASVMTWIAVMGLVEATSIASQRAPHLGFPQTRPASRSAGERRRPVRDRPWCHGHGRHQYIGRNWGTCSSNCWLVRLRPSRFEDGGEDFGFQGTGVVRCAPPLEVAAQASVWTEDLGKFAERGRGAASCW